MVLLATAMSAGLGACRSAGTAVTFEPGVEHLPGPGYIHLVTNPATLDVDAIFTLIGPDGADSTVHAAIAAGTPVVVDLTTLPGPHAMRMDDTACDGRFAVQSEQVTEVVVRITTDGCSTTVSGIRDAEEMRQP